MVLIFKFLASFKTSERDDILDERGMLKKENVQDVD